MGYCFNYTISRNFSEAIIMTNKKYDWKITALKFFWSFIEVLIAGAVVYFTEIPELLIIVPVLEAVRNWIKHR